MLAYVLGDLGALSGLGAARLGWHEGFWLIALGLLVGALVLAGIRWERIFR